jgi:hypothetical protein
MVGMDWIGLAQDRGKWRALVNVVMNPLGFIKCWEILESGSQNTATNSL